MTDFNQKTHDTDVGSHGGQSRQMMEVFENQEFGSIRLLQEAGKTFFCASDVAKALGYVNPYAAVKRHCRGPLTKREGVVQKVNQYGNAGEQVVEISFITEGDVYRLIVHSKLPSAERFEHWVFDEVLPSIRKHGVYAQTPEELYDKSIEMKRSIEDEIFRKNNPTVAEYCEKWLKMRSASVRENTLSGYERTIRKYIIGAIGDMYMDEVTTDDLRLLLVPISKQSASLYSKMNMLIKCVFYSAEESKIISYNPAASLSAKGGTPKQEKKALTDEQVKILLDTIRGLPPYVFVMIGLYAGLRREEILALRWDCVFLDGATPYISVRRAWRSVNNRPVISTELKTPAAKRDIPIPGKLVECLKEAKEKSKSEYVISDRNGNALAESQFVRVWKYIAVRSTEERCYYTYVNGQKIKHVVKPKLGEHQPNNLKLVYTMDFQVTPHQLRHTYITNLIYASVDPKTVQYLAGHENSKVTMDIYAKVKYNKPAQLHGVINRAIDTSKKD